MNGGSEDPKGVNADAQRPSTLGDDAVGQLSGWRQRAASGEDTTHYVRVARTTRAAYATIPELRASTSKYYPYFTAVQIEVQRHLSEAWSSRPDRDSGCLIPRPSVLTTPNRPFAPCLLVP